MLSTANIDRVAFRRPAGAAAELEYSLVDDEDSQLLLDPRTGVLTLGRPLDREQQAMFNISVMATDGGTPALSGTAAIILLVQGESGGRGGVCRSVQGREGLDVVSGR